MHALLCSENIRSIDKTTLNTLINIWGNKLYRVIIYNFVKAIITFYLLHKGDDKKTLFDRLW